MTLDIVVSGCAAYCLESENGRDPRRAEILEGCLTDLTHLLPGLSGEAIAYFERCRLLACLLLRTSRRQ